MPKDTLVRNDLSPVDNMYIIHSGRCLVFGRCTTNILSLEFKSVNDVIGDDICTLLVGDRAKHRRHYTARSSTVLQVYVLPGDVFCEIIDAGVFDEFKVGTRRYGCFLRIKRALILHARARICGKTHHRGHRFSYSDQVQLNARGGRIPSSDDDDADDDADDEIVLRLLYDFVGDVEKLRIAPDLIKRQFASQNTDLTALSPMFADLQRRVLAALGTRNPRHLETRMPSQTVSKLEHEQIKARSGFTAAMH